MTDHKPLNPMEPSPADLERILDPAPRSAEQKANRQQTPGSVTPDLKSEPQGQSQDLTDAQGKSVAVPLPTEENRQRLEDSYDGQTVRERRADPTLSLADLKSRLGLDD